MLTFLPEVASKAKVYVFHILPPLIKEPFVKGGSG